MNPHRGPFFAAAALALHVLQAPLAAQIALEALATHSTGVFNKTAAEIVAYDPEHHRLFVTNRAEKNVTVLDLSDPSAPAELAPLDVAPFGDVPLSVDVAGALVAVAVQASPSTDPGKVVFFSTDGAFLNAVAVGSLPDKVKFTPDGRKVLTANEGEPSPDYTIDPEGSVSIIDVSRGAERAAVQTADFTRFNSRADSLRRQGVRIFGPNATVAQDIEPENIAIDEDSRTAWVTLQENNAIAVIDIRRARIERIVPLGFKVHLFRGNGIDGSDKDGGINIQTWPVLGMYQSDAIAVFKHRGRNYLLTANEGDSRGYPGFSEEARAADLTLGGPLATHFPGLQAPEQLGRLRVTNSPPFGTTTGEDGKDVFHLLFSFGGRSFSVWTEEARLVFDSGDDFEQITAARAPADFNSTDSANKSFDTRSDDKGPEPEELVVGEVDGRTYVFVGLERQGGVMVYDVSDPRDPTFVDYVNTRDFGATDPNLAGGLSPEGLAFIPAEESPSGEPLLAQAYTVSGSVTIFRVVCKSAGRHRDR